MPSTLTKLNVDPSEAQSTPALRKFLQRRETRHGQKPVGWELLVDENDPANGVNVLTIEELDLPPITSDLDVKVFPDRDSSDSRAQEFLVENERHSVFYAVALVGGKRKRLLASRPGLKLVVTPPGTSAPFSFEKTIAKVLNRGKPPAEFLAEMVAWGREAAGEIFAERPAADNETDVFASANDQLGPYGDVLHRKAVMLEIMRVLAGFESSWDWTEGRDVTNPDSNRPETTEAGAFQVSANSMSFGQDLKDLVQNRAGSRDPLVFQEAMKEDHVLAMEYIARLLRHTIRHNGPVKRHEINRWLRRDAVMEFRQALTA